MVRGWSKKERQSTKQIIHAVPLRFTNFAQAVADWLSDPEDSLLARIGTFVPRVLTGLFQTFLPIQRLDPVFRTMLERVKILLIPVRSIDAAAMMHQFRLKLHGAAC